MLNQNVLFSLTSVLTIALGTIAGASPAMAASEKPALTVVPTLPSTLQAESQVSEVVPQTTCKLALVAQAENPVVYGSEKMVGRVYNVVGDSVYMDLDDGTTAVANLLVTPEAELGALAERVWRAHAKFSGFRYREANESEGVEPEGPHFTTAEAGDYRTVVAQALERMQRQEQAERSPQAH